MKECTEREVEGTENRRDGKVEKEVDGEEGRKTRPNKTH